MKLNKFAYLYSKPLRNHTLKIMEKYLEIYFKNLEISWNFISLKKWEPCCYILSICDVWFPKVSTGVTPPILKKTARFKRVFIVAKLVLSGNQCNTFTEIKIHYSIFFHQNRHTVAVVVYEVGYTIGALEAQNLM